MGTILAYKGAISNIPDKWALCDGNHGTPNLSGRFLEGVTSSPGSTKSAGLPNITGHSTVVSGEGNPSTGSLQRSNRQNFNYSTSAGTHLMLWEFDFDASKSNSIYGSSSTVQPNAYTVLYIMKIKA